MNYLLARNAFLKSCGDPQGEDRLRAIAAFDQTLVAQQAQFLYRLGNRIDERRYGPYYSPDGNNLANVAHTFFRRWRLAIVPMPFPGKCGQAGISAPPRMTSFGLHGAT